MSATTGSATPLPHRAVANIKSPGGGGGGHGGGGGSGLSGPSTPMRGIASNFGSPSSLRAEEDLLLIEFGTRKLHIGFAGDAVPRGTVWFGPDQQRRVGDFRIWQPDYLDDWTARASRGRWGKDHELWQPDVRGLDLGLVGDKIERALREAITKYMLIDSRPRRIACVLPSGLPVPILSATLDTLFGRFLAPTISLLSIPVAVTVGAGVRSALVVDIGWNETVVTSVYEYREVRTDRSIRAGRMLTEQTHKLLANHLPQPQRRTKTGPGDIEYVLSFEECSELAARVVWCKPSQHSSTTSPQEGLSTVHEQDESDARSHHQGASSATTTISLDSSAVPASLELSFDHLAEPCENTFFDAQYSPRSFDDHELPLDMLVYRSLLELPVDVRALCMSRIIFTGGGAKLLGLRGRIFDDVSHLIRKRGWDPVRGKESERPGIGSGIKKRGSRQAHSGSTGVQSDGQEADGKEQDEIWHDAANITPDVDPVEEQLKKGREREPEVRGKMRAVESLGAWSGASLITQLKAPAIATVDRDIWQQQGAAGASRPGDVDTKSQRQSMGPARSAASGSWTLGVWGAP